MEENSLTKPRELKIAVRKPVKEPSDRAKLAVMFLGENGGNKRKALLQAGYSQKIADNPNRVFGTPAVQALLEDCGIHPDVVVRRIYRHMYARKPVHMVFPVYNPEKAREWASEDDATKEDHSDKIFKSQMTDQDIRDFIAGNNGTVFKIEHGDTARHVYYWADDSKSQLEAGKMFKDMFGLDAPKKVDLKGNIAHTFSLSRLRTRMEENDYQVIKPKTIDV